MANGSIDYSLGTLKATTDEQERRITEMESEIKTIRTYVEQQKGGWKMVRNIGVILGVIQAVHLVISIVV